MSRMPVSAFPTDSAERQKKRKEEVEKELLDQGATREETKLLKKKKQIQEEIFDDCGSCTDAIEDIAERALLTVSNDIDDLVEYCFDTGCGRYADFDDIDDEITAALGNEFELQYMLGSEGEEDEGMWRAKHPDSVYVALEDLNVYMQTKKGFIYVMEIFGGSGGVTKIAIRRRLATGKNVDIITGIDLTIPENVGKLMDYIFEQKPLVIMGPPCTAFANWSRLNRAINPQSYVTQRRIGEALAEVAVMVALEQIRQGRYFLIENPRGSEFFLLSCMQKLWKTGKVGKIKFPQCPLGLVNRSGEPILKWTEVWSNTTHLLDPFVGLECRCRSHGELIGSVETRHAAAWPLEVCRRIVA